MTNYFLMSVILSILGWTGLARTVRVTAAQVSGTTNYRVITRHIHVTLAIPGMIIGETGLSFLGIGLTSPAVSWGVALQQAHDVSVIALNWWLLIPAIFVVSWW